MIKMSKYVCMIESNMMTYQGAKNKENHEESA